MTLCSKPIPLFVRFWEKVNFGPSCWEWTASLVSGYGGIRHGGTGSKTLYAHRLSWEWHYGPIPDGLCVLHRCDNRLCVCPEHLFLGTRSDNMKDMTRKGRHGRRKFTDDEVLNVRRSKVSAAKLARYHNVCVDTIWNIRARRTWAHI